MAKLKCTIVDAATNRPVDAKVHVLSSQGAFVSPPEAILKVGAGPRFFYAHEGFEVDLPIGQADVVVERGTDWFVCSSNRVYVASSADFSYDSWLAGLKRGSTFITNGPALFLDVGGSPVGSVVEVANGAISAECTVRWESHYPVDLVELVINGRVAASANSVDRERTGMWETAVQISHDSWIAARLWGRARNSFDHAIYAHTSPVYVDVGRSDPTRSESSRFFVESIDRSLDWVKSSGRYTTDRQRDEISELFLEGRARYAERV